MFDEVELPAGLIAFGSRAGPGHSTGVVETDSGAEGRVSRYAGPRWRLEVDVVERSNEEVAELRRFAIARRGAARGFRVKDHNDFTSALDGVSAPAVNDVQIGTGDGSETQFQLVKTYTSGLSTITRIIRKPVAATVIIAVNGVTQAAGVNYTFDTTTGIVTMTAAPGLGLAVTAGFEFRVAGRFSLEVDQWLASSRSDVDSSDFDGLEIIEEVNPAVTPGIRPHGGAVEKSMTASITVSLLEAALYVVDPQTTGLSVLLPTPAGLPTGCNLWTITNIGANSVTVKDHAAATLATLATGQAVDIHLSDDGAGGFVWYAC